MRLSQRKRVLKSFARRKGTVAQKDCSNTIDRVSAAVNEVRNNIKLRAAA